MIPGIGDVPYLAFERARITCVARFDPAKWLWMALVSWLAWLGPGTGVRWKPRLGLPADLRDLSLPSELLPEMQPLVGIAAVVTATLGLAVGVVIWLAVGWIRARGQAMFLDLVVRDSGDPGTAWQEQGALANDLFRVRVGLDLAGALLAMLLGGAGAGAALLLEPRVEAVWAWASLGLALLAVWGVGLAWAAAGFVLDDLVLPVAYAWEVPILEAAREIRRMASELPGAFAAYLGLRLLSALVVAVGSVALTLALCVVSWLPFVSSLLLLPLRVFLQGLPLAFLHQLNPDAYATFAPPEEAAG